MKRLMCTLLITIAVLLLGGCGSLSNRGEELTENVTSYMNIAEYAAANFRISEYSVSSDRYVVVLNDIKDVDVISSDVLVTMQDYTYFWIEDSCVIFWNDETKTEGILCAFDSEKALNNLKSWYADVQVEKLSKGCYLLTQARAWIG